MENIFYSSLLENQPIFSKKDSIEEESILNESIFDENFDFDWDMLDVIIGGKSSIDLSRLAINSIDEADSFAKIYGYDLSKDYIIEEVKNLFNEAVYFLETLIIPDPFTKISYLEIPSEIKNEKDIRKIILYASDLSNPLQLWACAILRIMHTISYVNNDISQSLFPEIQKQILERFWSAIYINEKGEKFLGEDETGIKLYDIEIKAKKERNSIILKLLHKIENVATDVFDKIGIRLITYSKLEALLVIRHLRTNGVFSFCNVKPSRSRNSLIDTEVLQNILEEQKIKLQNDEITKEDFYHNIKQECEKCVNLGVSENILNPLSSSEYRSIQFTSRQMIRMKNPLITPLENDRQDFCFFFPYEIQVVDYKTHRANLFGKASHEKYKEKQLIKVRHRILGKLLGSKEVFV